MLALRPPKNSGHTNSNEKLILKIQTIKIKFTYCKQIYEIAFILCKTTYKRFMLIKLLLFFIGILETIYKKVLKFYYTKLR